MNIECKYCDAEDEKIKLFEQSINAGEQIIELNSGEVNQRADNDKYIISITYWNHDVYKLVDFEINYCPMCGRELNA